MRGSGAYLQRGGTLPIHVIANRHGGFSGPISLRVEGLPEGVTCPPFVMAPFQNEIDVILSANEQAVAWNGPLRVVASSKLGEQTIEQTVQWATVWQNPSAERGPVQSRLCDELWLSIKEDWPPLRSCRLSLIR